MGRPKKKGHETPDGLTSFGGVGYSFAASSATDAWLVYSAPGPDADAVSCGFLLRAGTYGHILAGERRLMVDPQFGWPTSMEIEATDDLGRQLFVRGEAVSRHWRGNGGDTLFHWDWDQVEGWGEDQSYFSPRVWESRKSSSGGGSRD
jgi:hypothetical protein